MVIPNTGILARLVRDLECRAREKVPLFGSAPSEGLPLLHLVPGWLAEGGGQRVVGEGVEVVGHFAKAVGRLRYRNEG